jgi:hypothetical protein
MCVCVYVRVCLWMGWNLLRTAERAAVAAAVVTATARPPADVDSTVARTTCPTCSGGASEHTHTHIHTHTAYTGAVRVQRERDWGRLWLPTTTLYHAPWPPSRALWARKAVTPGRPTSSAYPWSSNDLTAAATVYVHVCVSATAIPSD